MSVYYLVQVLWVGSLERHRGWFGLAVFFEVGVKTLSRVTVFRSPGSPEGLLHSAHSDVRRVIAGCWQETSAHCSADFLVKLLGNSHDMATRLLPKAVIQENVSRSHGGFSGALGSHMVISAPLLVGRSVLFSMREDV